MKLGLYSMIAKEMSPAEVVALCCELGIEGIEWVQRGPERGGHLDSSDFVGSAARVGEMAREAGLEIVDFTGFPEADDPERLKLHFEIAEAMGAPAMRMRSESFWRQPGKSLAEQQDHVRRVLEGMLTQCEKHGVSVQYETVWGSVLASASMARRLYEGLDPTWFGMLIDPANMIIEGYEGWRVACEVLGPYLHNVHCKNVWFEPTQVGDSGQIRWRYLFRPVRIGMVNWPDVIDALKESGYDGYLCIEDCDETYPSDYRIREAVSFLRPLMS